jgi:hypothetical protein
VNIEQSVVSNGTTKAMRFIEIDKARTIPDHLMATYYKSSNALVQMQLSSKYVHTQRRRISPRDAQRR